MSTNNITIKKHIEETVRDIDIELSNTKDVDKKIAKLNVMLASYERILKLISEDDYNSGMCKESIDVIKGKIKYYKEEKEYTTKKEVTRIPEMVFARNKNRNLKYDLKYITNYEDDMYIAIYEFDITIFYYSDIYSLSYEISKAGDIISTSMSKDHGLEKDTEVMQAFMLADLLQEEIKKVAKIIIGFAMY